MRNKQKISKGADTFLSINILSVDSHHKKIIKTLFQFVRIIIKCVATRKHFKLKNYLTWLCLSLNSKIITFLIKWSCKSLTDFLFYFHSSSLLFHRINVSLKAECRNLWLKYFVHHPPSVSLNPLLSCQILGKVDDSSPTIAKTRLMASYDRWFSILPYESLYRSRLMAVRNKDYCYFCVM